PKSPSHQKRRNACFCGVENCCSSAVGAEPARTRAEARSRAGRTESRASHRWFDKCKELRAVFACGVSCRVRVGRAPFPSSEGIRACVRVPRPSCEECSAISTCSYYASVIRKSQYQYGIATRLASDDFAKE